MGLTLCFLLGHVASINSGKVKYTVLVKKKSFASDFLITEADFLLCTTYRGNTAHNLKKHTHIERISRRRAKPDLSLFPLLSVLYCLPLS